MLDTKATGRSVDPEISIPLRFMIVYSRRQEVLNNLLIPKGGPQGPELDSASLHSIRLHFQT